MSTSLLTIFNVAAEDDTCRLFLPYWQRSGCDILFSSPHDSKSQLDGVLHYHTGKAMIRDGSVKDRLSWWWYQARVLETMRFVSTLPYTTFIFTQYDSICLDALPALAPKQVIANLACGPMAGYKAIRALHPPWGFGREALQIFIQCALQFNIQTTESGVMDRWIALVLESSGLAVEDTASWSWSANSINTPALVKSCREAIQAGFKFFHGVKDAGQLVSILPP